MDNIAGSSAATSPMFAMSGDGKEIDDVTIPVVFLFFTEAAELMTAINMANGDLTVTLGNYEESNIVLQNKHIVLVHYFLILSCLEFFKAKILFEILFLELLY